jgi:Skp family chaperone for outer membrane proteins
MVRSSLLVLALILAVTAAAQADVYKYVDAQGHVQYTDRPQTLPAERLNIRSQKTDTVTLEGRGRALTEAATVKAYQDAAARKAEEKAASQTAAQDRVQRCVKARERYDSYVTSQRLYELLPNGERRYLTDEELDRARASAKVSMDELCKGL